MCRVLSQLVVALCRFLIFEPMVDMLRLVYQNTIQQKNNNYHAISYSILCYNEFVMIDSIGSTNRSVGHINIVSNKYMTLFSLLKKGQKNVKHSI